MKQIRTYLDKIMRVINALVFAILSLLTIWQVSTRYLLSDPSTWSEELASYLFAWVTLLGAAYVFGKREHMNIPIITDKVSPKTQRILAIINESIIFLFAIFVLVYGGLSITSLTMGQMSSSLPIKMGYFYAAIPISGVFIAIYSVLNIYDLFKGNTINRNANGEITIEDTHA
ncbi:TRAP transporter small permease [Lacticigenium naphthae]|uniref:TRAP transporter small permease n=1 Tax=Lacticigenium naphthae TaxID=515351 RepID=UPI0004216971|nr:TRAP transporter small permease [Lacticigenium naphthae]